LALSYQFSIRNNRLSIHEYINPTASSGTVIQDGDYVAGQIAAIEPVLQKYRNH
jgi:hypothetical protein